MARALGVSPAYLGAIEHGQKAISPNWLCKTKAYFLETFGKVPQGLDVAAVLSNQTIDLNQVHEEQRHLVVKLAFLKDLSPAKLAALNELIDAASADHATASVIVAAKELDLSPA